MRAEVLPVLEPPRRRQGRPTARVLRNAPEALTTEGEPVTAWHNDPDLKAEVLARMIAHREADEIIQGVYQDLDPNLASGYRGCLIGCTLPKLKDRWSMSETWQELVEKYYGIPAAVGYLLDYTFESLDYGDHAAFAVNSIEAIPIGADLTAVPDLFVLELLAEAAKRLDGPAVAASAAVAELVQRRMAGDEPTDDQWNDAYNASLNSLAPGVAIHVADIDDAHYGHAVSVFQRSRQSRAERAWAPERLLHLLRSAPIPAPAAAGEQLRAREAADV